MLNDNTELLTALPEQYLSEITRLLDDLDARPRPTHSPRGLSQRGTLGDFANIYWFKALLAGFEDLLGDEAAKVVFTRAGRLRGERLVEDWGIGHLSLPLPKIGHLLDAALGHDGTRLCAVHSVEGEPECIVVNVSETICSAGEPQGSPRRCTFTLGAVWGALETLTGQTYRAEQTGSVLAGDPYDQFTFRPLT